MGDHHKVVAIGHRVSLHTFTYVQYNTAKAWRHESLSYHDPFVHDNLGK